jgi:hypothetical protein
VAELLRLTEIDLGRARRKLKKKVAAALITAMAETDADYEFMGKRLGDTPENIEQYIVGLISGKSKCMEELSDLLLALGCEFSFGLHQYQLPARPQPQPETPAQEQAAARLRAVLLNIQAAAESGYPIDGANLATRCRRALANVHEQSSTEDEAMKLAYENWQPDIPRS